MDSNPEGESRRNVLRMAGGLGFTTASLSQVAGMAQAVEPTSDDRIRVVAGYKHTNHSELDNGVPPKRTPIYRILPREDWIDIEASYNAASRVSKRFSDDSLSFGIENDPESHTNLVVTANWNVTKSSDGEIRTKPDISFEEFKDQVPATEDGIAKRQDISDGRVGIPVRAKKNVRREQNYYSGQYRPVPGGCKATNAYTEDFTLCASVWDNDHGERVMVTAGHCVNRESGTDVYQPSSSIYDSHIGLSDKYNTSGNGDAATIRTNADPQLTYNLVDDDDSNGEITNGILTDDDLKVKAYYQESILKQGEETGRLRGTVQEVDEQSSGETLVVCV